MAEYHYEKFAELQNVLAPYMRILLDKPQYTTEETDLWFKFMKTTTETPMLALFAMDKVLETLSKWFDETDNEVRLGGTPKRFLKLNFTPDEHSGYEPFFAIAYEEDFNVTNWCVRCVGFDLVRHTAVLADTKDSSRAMFMSLNTFSSHTLCQMLATLRTIRREEIDKRPVVSSLVNKNR